ncbi:RDD family protein [Phycicoccus flavus]|uniref:RDD family protein n=1 Tax=Phycicoccus flavus TaxID=2502783 RepID=UPI000FEB5EF1|nr:RDD family protein [Phycicoccus flavus]NHA69886.1 RDD family protein [Phycicoccus flavus]
MSEPGRGDAVPPGPGPGPLGPDHRLGPAPLPGPAAGFGTRVLASLLDTAVSLVASLPAFAGLALALTGLFQGVDVAPDGAVTGTGDGGLLTAGLALLLLGWLLASAVTLWNRVFRMGRTGRSLGKSWTGIVLVDAESGGPIGAGRCFGREVTSNVVNQLLLLSSLWMLWDDRQQTLADNVVGSAVLRAPTSGP